MPLENVQRLLVLVAHPDDESIGCGVLMQRMSSSLVVFAVDGAPAGYGFERKSGSLRNYSEERFREATRALANVPNCSFQRLKTRAGKYFPDRQLFKYLEEASASLIEIAKQFAPDAIVSHAYEGGHIDHDACSFLAKHAAHTLLLKHFEFPLYWQDAKGRDVFQEFRDPQEEGAFSLVPSQAEITIKNEMLAEYKTQQDIVTVFSTKKESFRQVPCYDYARPHWNAHYPGDWRTRRDGKSLLRRFSQFRGLGFQ